jgi:hypothetical protein
MVRAREDRMKALVAVFAVIAVCGAAAAKEPEPGAARACETSNSASFARDADIQEIAEAYHLDAIDFARDNFSITLDSSDASVEQVERMLDVLHQARASDRPSDELVTTVSRMFGSYVGETYRRNHGGTWGMVTLQGQTFPGFEASDCGLFWPWGKVENRLTNGTEDNVWHYYNALLEDDDD